MAQALSADRAIAVTFTCMQRGGGKTDLDVYRLSRRFEDGVKVVQDLLLVRRDLGLFGNDGNVNVAHAVPLALHQPHRLQQEDVRGGPLPPVRSIYFQPRALRGADWRIHRILEADI